MADSNTSLDFPQAPAATPESFIAFFVNASPSFLSILPIRYDAAFANRKLCAELISPLRTHIAGKTQTEKEAEKGCEEENQEMRNRPVRFFLWWPQDNC